MAHAENQVTINRSVSDVFSFLLDGANNSRWRPGVLDIQHDASTPAGLGAVYKQGLKGPGGRIDGDYKITRVEPDQRIEFQVIAGPARPTGIYTLEPAGNATKVSFVLDFQPKGLAKLMDGIIAKTMQTEVGQLSALKSVLESGGLK
jgi:uncharacterized protein YndB with AHSA1/START domain